jgi:hypothetical protein
LLRASFKSLSADALPGAPAPPTVLTCAALGPVIEVMKEIVYRSPDQLASHRLPSSAKPPN